MLSDVITRTLCEIWSGSGDRITHQLNFFFSERCSRTSGKGATRPLATNNVAGKSGIKDALVDQ